MQMIQALLFLLALISPMVPVEAQVEPPFLISRIGRGTIDSVQWHPDGSYIMVTTITGTWIYTPDLQDLAHIPAYFAQMSPDGRYIAGVDKDALLHLWDANTFELIENDDPQTIRQISLFKWSPDSRYIIVAGQMRDHDMTLIWYVPLINDYTLYDSEFNEVVWSPDGRYLVRPSSTHIVVLKSGVSAFESVIDYQPDFYFREEPRVIWDDETHLVIAGGGPLNNIWINVETKQVEILPYTSTQWMRHLMNPAGTISLITGGDGFTLTNLENPAQSLKFPYDEDFSMVAWDHTGRFLAVGENTYSSQPADIRVIDLQTFEVTQHLAGLSSRIENLIWSPDDRSLIATDANQRLFVYDTTTWHPRASNFVHTAVGATLAWNPNDTTQFALADTLGNLALWKIETAKQERVFPHSGLPIMQIKWQPSGSLIATLAYAPFGDEGFAQVLDTGDGNQGTIGNFQGGIGVISGFEWSSDGDELAMLSSGVLSLWDLDTRSLQYIKVANETWVDDLAWSPNKEFFVFLSGESSSQSQMYTLATQTAVWGVGNPEYSLATWTPDNTWLVLTWSGQHRPNFTRPLLTRFTSPFEVEESMPPSIGSPTSSDELIGLTSNAKIGFLSPQGLYAAAVNDAHAGIIWDTSTTKPLTMLADTANIVWSPGETHAIAQRTDGSVWFLTGEGQILAQIPMLVTTQEARGTFIWSPDSRQVAYLHDGLVETWQVLP